MPIIIAPENVDLTVQKILVDEKTKKHLSNLGLTINATIKVISKVGKNVIISIKDGRLALDGNIATKIFVA